jgi:hypothetical protein
MSEDQELEPEKAESPTRSYKKINQVEKELERHLALFPGEYRIDESFNSIHNNKYREWIRKKIDLIDFIQLHKLLNTDNKKSYVVESKLDKPERLKSKIENSLQDYYRSFQESMEFLALETLNSQAWKNERCRASSLRNKIIEICRRDGIKLPKPLPKLPQVPRLPVPVFCRKD